MAQLSELSRRALHGAEQLAAQFHHDRTGLVHVLYMLAHESRSVCSEALLEAGLDRASLDSDLAANRSDAWWSSSAADLTERAAVIARAYGSHYVGTDHLLLAILAKPEGEALLARYGAAPGEVERRLQLLIRPSLSNDS